MNLLLWPLRLVIALVFLWVGGFLWFVAGLSPRPIEPAPADGIVVLTGSVERLKVGFELLRAGKGERLLFTGVAQGSHPRHFAALFADDPTKAECCVDLGHEALDTIGNAVETAAWVAQRNMASLIVVTSAYHMPRALIELRRAMPVIRLEPRAVMDTREPLSTWWHNGATARLLASEFTKYLAALVRARMQGWVS